MLAWDAYLANVQLPKSTARLNFKTEVLTVQQQARWKFQIILLPNKLNLTSCCEWNIFSKNQQLLLLGLLEALGRAIAKQLSDSGGYRHYFTLHKNIKVAESLL